MMCVGAPLVNAKSLHNRGDSNSISLTGLKQTDSQVRVVMRSTKATVVSSVVLTFSPDTSHPQPLSPLTVLTHPANLSAQKQPHSPDFVPSLTLSKPNTQQPSATALSLRVDFASGSKETEGPRVKKTNSKRRSEMSHIKRNARRFALKATSCVLGDRLLPVLSDVRTISSTSWQCRFVLHNSSAGCFRGTRRIGRLWDCPRQDVPNTTDNSDKWTCKRYLKSND